MEQDRVYKFYAFGLIWLSLIFAVIAEVSNIIELIFVDFAHGNPHRPHSNSVTMMWMFTPMISIIAVIGCLLVFSFPQASQAFLHERLRTLSRIYSVLIVVGVTPVISVLTWYCWEYLTPADFNFGFNEGDDWRPYQHGITLQRYIDALAFQVPVSLYSLLFCEPYLIRSSRKMIVTLGLAVAVLIGVVYGHHLAEQQYKFI